MPNDRTEAERAAQAAAEQQAKANAMPAALTKEEEDAVRGGLMPRRPPDDPGKLAAN